MGGFSLENMFTTGHEVERKRSDILPQRWLHEAAILYQPHGTLMIMIGRKWKDALKEKISREQ
jgi:hypothetical protein